MLVLCLGLLTVCDIWGLERESNYLLLTVILTVLFKLAHQEYLKHKVRQCSSQPRAKADKEKRCDGCVVLECVPRER